MLRHDPTGHFQISLISEIRCSRSIEAEALKSAAAVFLAAIAP